MCEPCPKMLELLNEMASKGVDVEGLKVHLYPALESGIRPSDVVSFWNELGPPYGKVIGFRSGTPRYNHVQARLRDPFFVENLGVILAEFKENPFLRGEGNRHDRSPGTPFRFDWLISNADNARKLMEWRERRLREGAGVSKRNL